MTTGDDDDARHDDDDDSEGAVDVDGSHGVAPFGRSNEHGSRTADSDRTWQVVESPTEKSLYGVVDTAREPFAVGTEGTVLARTDDGWRVVVEAGPATRANRLTTVDVTDDGERIWFAGSSGALGAYDVQAGRKHDYSAPKEKTSTWEAIAVIGNAGSEALRVANGSGEVLPITTDENGCPQPREVVKPGSGSTIAALDFGGEACYAADTSGNVFVERDDGWEDIGIENAQVNFFDLLAAEKRVLVTGGGGRVYRYDRVCDNWTPIAVGEGALYAIDGTEGTAVVAGADGRIYERGLRGWTATHPVSADCFAIALGVDDSPDVAVGANGTIVERDRSERANGDESVVATGAKRETGEMGETRETEETGETGGTTP